MPTFPTDATSPAICMTATNKKAGATQEQRGHSQPKFNKVDEKKARGALPVKSARATVISVKQLASIPWAPIFFRVKLKIVTGPDKGKIFFFEYSAYMQTMPAIGDIYTVTYGGRNERGEDIMPDMDTTPKSFSTRAIDLMLKARLHIMD
ncbi:MAG: hypothetical protein PHH14_04635 [Candidatus Margulisbacteria bacterium]|nr:hypothetical protein [Candidatus Margulisiibacteriota bacterium]